MLIGWTGLLSDLANVLQLVHFHLCRVRSELGWSVLDFFQLFKRILHPSRYHILVPTNLFQLYARTGQLCHVCLDLNKR